jgi:hypothetical protein
MTVAAISIALVALLGSLFLWLRLQQVTASLAQLVEPATPPKVVLRELPPVIAPDTVIGPATSRSLIILGYRNDIVILDNQSNADHIAVKEFTFDIPQGTTDILPLMSGFNIFYGTLDKVVDAQDGLLKSSITDHNLGFQWVNIRVVEIRTASATVEIQMSLRDADGDDEWAGFMHVHLLFLARHVE